MKKILIILLLIIFTSSTIVFALTEYYVDASRDSSGDGSEADPWKTWGNINWTTIDTALTSDNTIIYLSSQDTWSSTAAFTVESSGSATYLLTLDGESKYNLVNSGAASWQTETDSNNRAILTNSGGNGGDLKFNNSSSYVTVTGFNIFEPTFSGVNLGTVNPTTDIHHITINNCIIDTPVNNHGIWFGFAESGCSDITISNNTIMNVQLEGIYMGHFNYFSDIIGIVIENNTLIDCGLAGEGDIDLKPPCNGAIVRNNIHYRTAGQDNGKVSGTVIQADNCQVYGNEFYNMDEEASDWGFGIYLTGDGDGTTGVTITSALIYNNLLYDNDRSGIKISATKSGFPMSGVKVYNNTIAGNGTQGIQITTSNTTVTIAEMKNNVIFSSTNFEMFVSSGVTLSDVDYNLYYRASGNSFSYQGAEKTWAQWQGLGFDANGLNTDPLLNGDYTPNDSSPVVDVGIDLSGTFTTDKNNITRPQGSAWDMGAYEFISGGIFFPAGAGGFVLDGGIKWGF